MKFLIDECLHKSLVGVAHASGFEATHVNHLGLSGQPDWALAERITKNEFTFVSNNRVDFIQLFGRMELHAGLIAWFQISFRLSSVLCSRLPSDTWQEKI
jgi:predicted nuclease of predicted toxin-antitoxin system